MDRDQETLLVLAARAIRFASDHPYAATGIFGAAVGSAVTYRVMTRSSAQSVFSPKVYEFALTPEDLERLKRDPTAELRWEMPTMTVVVTSEKRERPPELPDIIVE